MSWWSAVCSRSSVQWFRVALAPGLVAAGLIAARVVLAAATGWRVQRSPNPSKSLSGVAATSSTNAWAVGFDTTAP